MTAALLIAAVAFAFPAALTPYIRLLTQRAGLVPPGVRPVGGLGLGWEIDCLYNQETDEQPSFTSPTSSRWATLAN